MKTSAADLGRAIPTFDAAGFMTLNTVISGHLYVGSALPDPPFEFMDGDNARGFDVELMQAIAAERRPRFVLPKRRSGSRSQGPAIGLSLSKDLKCYLLPAPELAADFAAFVLSGMNVDIQFTGL